MTNLTALKALYVALGGDADDVADITRNSACINAIATLVAAQPKLPAVKDTDAGKVLTVSNDGEWEAADLPD